jgi:hypothetical protein
MYNEVVSSKSKPSSSRVEHRAKIKHLNIASNLREAGHRTAIHALRDNFPEVYDHLDSLFKEGKSLRTIIRELDTKFHKELNQMAKLGFGKLSIQSLSAFKKNYWICLSGIPSLVDSIPKAEIEKRFSDWDSYNKMIEIAIKSIKMADRITNEDLGLSVYSETGRKLRKDAFEMANNLLFWEFKLGIRENNPQISSNLQVDDEDDDDDDGEDLIARGERALEILKTKYRPVQNTP